MVGLQVLEHRQCPLLVWLPLLGDAQVLAGVSGKAEEVTDHLVLLRWVDAGVWVDFVYPRTPVFPASDSLHVLYAGQRGLVGRHEEEVALTGLVVALLVGHESLGLPQLHLRFAMGVVAVHLGI